MSDHPVTQEVTTIKQDLHQMDKRLALLEQKVDQIDRNTDKIANGLAWLAKILGAALIGAIVAFIVGGGLTIQ